MIDTLGWLLIVAVMIFLVAVGGLSSSLMNRRYLRAIREGQADLKRTTEHTNKNMKMATAALQRRMAKEDQRPSPPE